MALKRHREQQRTVAQDRNRCGVEGVFFGRDHLSDTSTVGRWCGWPLRFGLEHQGEWV